MIRKNKVINIKVTDKLFLFRPCVGSNKYPGIINAALHVFPEVGIGLVTSNEQTCCGGFLTFTNVVNPSSTMPAVARNLAIIEESGCNVLTLCNGCYTFISEFAHFMNENPPVKKVVNGILSKIDHEYKGSQDIYHVFELFYRIKERIKEKVKRPLKGMRFATHYGCHYLNGFKTTAIDDAFMPTGLEEIIDILGGDCVEYSENRSCCGTGLTQVILHKEELSLPHTKNKLDNLIESCPDAVVVMCPYCLSQLDRMQQKFNSRKTGTYQIPVIHITQLVGLALGFDFSLLGFDAHAISVKPFLSKYVRQTSKVVHRDPLFDLSVSC